MSTDTHTSRVAVITAAASGIGEATVAIADAVTDRDSLVAAAQRVRDEPGAVTTELVSPITHGDTTHATEQVYEATAITADDVAQVIAFAVTRPRGVSLNEILLRPTAQAG